MDQAHRISFSTMLFLFGFALITVTPVSAQFLPPSLQVRAQYCTLLDLKMIAFSTRTKAQRELTVQEFFKDCVNPGTRRANYNNNLKAACEQVNRHIAVERRDGLKSGDPRPFYSDPGGGAAPEGSPVDGSWVLAVVGADGSQTPWPCSREFRTVPPRGGCSYGIHKAVNGLSRILIASDELIMNIVGPELCGMTYQPRPCAATDSCGNYDESYKRNNLWVSIEGMAADGSLRKRSPARQRIEQSFKSVYVIYEMMTLWWLAN